MLLERAGVSVDVLPVKLDEASVREAMVDDGAPPRDIADALAESKAKRAARKEPEAVVIGCDQVMVFEDGVFGKAATNEEMRRQLARLNGNTHELISAAVIYEYGQPVWRHVGTVRMHMRRFSDAYLNSYVVRNWDSIRNSLGGYKFEEEGARLFHRVEGDYFHVLGMPLLEILGYLTIREFIQG